MLKRSREAYLTLKFSSISDRKALVDQLIDYFKKNKEEIAKDITTMMGKPIV
jgi:acyl-CoA reductase-like NAD-dependent aldehyde dehydrogenase